MWKKSGSKRTGRKLSLRDTAACVFNAKVKAMRRHSHAKGAGKLPPNLDLRTRCGNTDTTKIDRVVFVFNAKVKTKRRHSNAQYARHLNPKLDLRNRCGTTEPTKKRVLFLFDLLQPAMYIAALQNVPSMQGSNLQGQELRKGDYTTALEALTKRPARCTNIQVSQLSL